MSAAFRQNAMQTTPVKPKTDTTEYVRMCQSTYLKLYWKQVHVTIFSQKLGDFCQVLVSMANDVHDRQQLPQ